MKKYSAKKFLNILKEIQNGATIAETCRKYNISRSTYYIWMNKHSLINTSDLKRLKNENAKLILFIVDQALDMSERLFRQPHDWFSQTGHDAKTSKRRNEIIPIFGLFIAFQSVTPISVFTIDDGYGNNSSCFFDQILVMQAKSFEQWLSQKP